MGCSRLGHAVDTILLLMLLLPGLEGEKPGLEETWLTWKMENEIINLGDTEITSWQREEPWVEERERMAGERVKGVKEERVVYCNGVVELENRTDESEDTCR
jgi:hypothetical protein